MDYDLPEELQPKSEPKVIDHIVAYDYPTKLYLVKWQDEGYDEATWESKVPESAIQAFTKREQYREIRPQHVSCEFKEYGTGEKCVPLPHYKNDNQLREYQVQALNWLLFAYKTHKNTILADEMGLGKTVQIVPYGIFAEFSAQIYLIA